MSKDLEYGKSDNLDEVLEDEGHFFVKKELHHDGGENSIVQNTSKKNKDKTNKINSSEKENIDQKLMEIYENPDGSMPDMVHFQKKKAGGFIRSIFVLMFACVFLAGVAWVGFFVIQPKSGFSEKDVVLSVSGPEFAKIGEDVRYRIRYRNSQNTPLTNVILQVRYPEGFVLSDSSQKPINETKDEWSLASLGQQESGFIDLFGRMYGDVGTKQSFRIFLNYKAENFSSDFQKVASSNLEIGESPIGLVVDGPKEVVAGSQVEFTVNVDNRGVELDNMAIEIESGTSFKISESVPKSDKFVTNRWYVGTLKDKKLVIKGVFNAGENPEKSDLNIKLVGWKDADRSVDGYTYYNQSYSVSYLKTDVTANLVLNGSSGNFNVQPGEVLSGSIFLKNGSNVPLKNVVARVIIDAPSYDKKSMLNWTEIENPKDADIAGEQLNADKRRGILTWTKTQIKDLTQIDPNEEITTDFSIPIKDSSNTDLNVFTNSEIQMTLEMRYDLNGESKIISSQPILMKINSDVGFELRDTIGDEGGKESHIMSWVITNTFHELSSIKIEADIYGDMVWNEDLLEVPGGVATFDKEKKKLTWTIDKMPLSVDIFALQFGYILNSKNPTQTDLTSKVTFEATDTVTGEQILKVGKEVLPED